MEFLRFCVFDQVTKASGANKNVCFVRRRLFSCEQTHKNYLVHRDVMSLRMCLARKNEVHSR